MKAFTVARSNVAVFVKIAWQGRLQRAGVSLETVTTRKLAPPSRLMARRRRDKWTPGPAVSLPEADGGPVIDLPAPDLVVAWVTFGDGTREVEGRVLAKTERAVLVEGGSARRPTAHRSGATL